MIQKETTAGGIVTERRVNVTATIEAIPPGHTRRFPCALLCKEATMRVLISRANAKAGRREFCLEVADSGRTFVVTRLG